MDLTACHTIVNPHVFLLRPKALTQASGLEIKVRVHDSSIVERYTVTMLKSIQSVSRVSSFTLITDKYSRL